jgi:hypothetical protein
MSPLIKKERDHESRYVWEDPDEFEEIDPLYSDESSPPVEEASLPLMEAVSLSPVATTVD